MNWNLIISALEYDQIAEATKRVCAFEMMNIGKTGPTI